MKIGVLASQGAFAEHISILQRLDIEAVPVRLPRDLRGLDGLVIPGGESSSIGKLMADYNLVSEMRDMLKNGLPALGTCAGMILLAKKISDSSFEPLGVMDITVKRNAFGRQVDSFEADLDIPAIGEPAFHAVFIRAPVIERVGDGVEVMAHLDDGTAVAARQGNLLALAFHPELTTDLRLHAYFLNLVERGQGRGK